MHSNIACTVLSNKYLFPQREYSENQRKGATLALSAVIVALFQPIAFVFTEQSFSFLLASLVFLASVVVQSISTSYKELALIEWCRPVDIHAVSSWLFFYQSLYCILFAPVLFYLSGLLDDFTFQEFSAILYNFSDGFDCVLGGSVFEDYPNYSTYNIDCAYGAGLLLLFVVSNLLVLQSIDRILFVGANWLGVAITLAFAASFITLKCFYEDSFQHGIPIIEVSSFALLLSGMLCYYADEEPDIEVVTSHSPLNT